MTVSDVYRLRRQGRIVEAYDAIRSLYANDKSAHTATAMFWTAVDKFRNRLNEGQTNEAQKILLALKRMIRLVPDPEGNAADTLLRCNKQLCTDPNTKAEHLLTGKWGEQIAAAYLRDKGYVILERDWHSGHRDIDIIAKKGTCVVFVEVKMRRNHNHAEPLTAVNHQKLRNLRMAINHYIKSHHVDCDFRFDVITIVGTPDNANPEIEHIEDFRMP